MPISSPGAAVHSDSHILCWAMPSRSFLVSNRSHHSAITGESCEGHAALERFTLRPCLSEQDTATKAPSGLNATALSFPGDRRRRCSTLSNCWRQSTRRRCPVADPMATSKLVVEAAMHLLSIPVSVITRSWSGHDAAQSRILTTSSLLLQRCSLPCLNTEQA